MVHIKKTIQGVTLTYNAWLKRILDKLHRKVTKAGWDGVVIVDGAERSGKSTLAQQAAAYLDPTFNINRVCIETEEFKREVINAKFGQAIVFDEAKRGLNSKRSMSEINVTLTSLFAEIGQKHLFIFIVMPTFFDLDKNIALWRSRYLLHVYTRHGNRGYAMLFNFKKKKTLYIFGKKMYNYNRPRSNFRFRFDKYSIIDDTAYNLKKAESLRGFLKTIEPEKRKTPDQFIAEERRRIVNTAVEANRALKNEGDDRAMKLSELSRFLGFKYHTFRDLIYRGNQMKPNKKLDVLLMESGNLEDVALRGKNTERKNMQPPEVSGDDVHHNNKRRAMARYG